jgi:hypothetical protein
MRAAGERARYDHNLATSCTPLSWAAFAAMQAAGKTMSLEQAISASASQDP